MKKYSVWLLILILIGNTYDSDLKADTIPFVDLSTISQVNQGNSYITFPTDIGNIEPLWFEANMIPNFHIRKDKNSRLMGVLTSQIIIRMFQEDSYPVKTPSYMPQLTIYYKLDKKEKNNTAFARLGHHSNGQDGDFYLANGTINLETGNFATNYIELGLIRTFFNTNLNCNQFFKTSFKHIFFEKDSELPGIYSNFRLINSFSVFKMRSEQNTTKKKKAAFSLKIDTEIMFGDYYTWTNKNINRINIGFTAFYAPTFFEDIGFFINFYHGQDYYNIYFDHQLNVIRFGFMTELLRF